MKWLFRQTIGYVFLMMRIIAGTVVLGQQRTLQDRRLQGFGVGVGLGTAAPAPFVPKADLSTISPTPTITTVTVEEVDTVLTPMPTLNPTPKGVSEQPTASPAIRSVTTPQPTPASTGGTIAVEGVVPVAELLQPLNFVVEFNLQTNRDLATSVDQVEDALMQYLSTIELSLDIYHTEGPMQISDLDFAPQGPCPGTPPDLVCERIQVSVWSKVTESSEFSDLIVSQRIRTEFVERFNYDSTDIDLSFEYPLLVVGKLRFAVQGPSRDMNNEEKGYFAAFAQRRVVEPIFDDQLSEEFLLRSVDWEYAYPFDTGDTSEIETLPSDEDEHVIEIFVLGSCRRQEACTNSKFQDHIEKNAVTSVDSLFNAVSAVGEEVSYFAQIETLRLLTDEEETNVPFSNEVVENEPPVSSNNSGNRESGTTTKQQIPLWVWMLVIADFAVLVGVFAYVSHKRNKRKVQGDKMRDSPEEKQNRRMQVTPFHQKPKTQEPVVKTAQQIEEEEYDARSYDFSIEAGDLSDDDSDVELSSFRRPRTKRF